MMCETKELHDHLESELYYRHQQETMLYNYINSIFGNAYPAIAKQFHPEEILEY